MLNIARTSAEAGSVDRWTIQARAERLRGEEMRRLAAALNRRVRNAIAGLSGRRVAGQAV